jgi:hypothetical protein
LGHSKIANSNGPLIPNIGATAVCAPTTLPLPPVALPPSPGCSTSAPDYSGSAFIPSPSRFTSVPGRSGSAQPHCHLPFHRHQARAQMQPQPHLCHASASPTPCPSPSRSRLDEVQTSRGQEDTMRVRMGARAPFLCRPAAEAKNG